MTRRTLLILGVLAVVLLPIAIWQASSSWQQEPVFDPEPFIPAFDASQAHTITLSFPDSGTISLITADDGLWRVKEKGNYPVNETHVQTLLRALPQLEILAPRTTSSTWHSNLHLVGPESGGRAVRVRVRTPEATTLAAFLVGKAPEGHARTGGRSLVYMRRSGENATWLVRTGESGFSLPPTLADWTPLDQLSPPIDSEVREAVLTTVGDATSLTASRPTPEDAPAITAGWPENQPDPDQGRVEGLIDLPHRFTADDVRASSLITTSHRARFTTFAGLVLTFSLAKDKEDRWWTQLQATATPDATEKTRTWIETRNHLINGWEFALPEHLVNFLARSPEHLVVSP